MKQYMVSTPPWWISAGMQQRIFTWMNYFLGSTQLQRLPDDPSSDTGGDNDGWSDGDDLDVVNKEYLRLHSLHPWNSPRSSHISKHERWQLHHWFKTMKAKGLKKTGGFQEYQSKR